MAALVEAISTEGTGRMKVHADSEDERKAGFGSDDSSDDTDVRCWPISANIREETVQRMDRLGRSADVSDLTQAIRGTVSRYALHEQQVHGLRTFCRLIGRPFGGVAADMGSGAGVGAAILSKVPDVSTVYAIEYSGDHVRRIMPAVFDRFDADRRKIRRVVGDFSHLQLDSGSLDLIIEIASYHHAEDLDMTLAEAVRVLQPGGLLVAIDRARPDHFTDAQLNALLDQPFNDDKKVRYGIPAEQHVTRRDWGEHEYRVRDWLTAFERAGLDAAVLTPWAPKWWVFKGALNRLGGFRLSLFVGAVLYRFGRRRFWCFHRSTKDVLFVCVRKAPAKP